MFSGEFLCAWSFDWPIKMTVTFRPTPWRTPQQNRTKSTKVIAKRSRKSGFLQVNKFFRGKRHPELNSLTFFTVNLNDSMAQKWKTYRGNCFFPDAVQTELTRNSPPDVFGLWRDGVTGDAVSSADVVQLAACVQNGVRLDLICFTLEHYKYFIRSVLLLLFLIQNQQGKWK